jgi:hypothetical protein
MNERPRFGARRHKPHSVGLATSAKGDLHVKVGALIPNLREGRALSETQMGLEESQLFIANRLRRSAARTVDGNACSPSISLNHLLWAITKFHRRRVVVRFRISLGT